MEKEIEVAEGVQVAVTGSVVKISKDGKEISRDFSVGKFKIASADGKIKISVGKDNKRNLKMLGTAAAHLKNMIKGVSEGFVYKMEVASVHFPMTVKVEGDKLTIKSLLGEKHDRAADILPDVKVDVKGQNVEVSSHDIEAAGQTAANIEKATKVRGRDRRIFQDGIFITEKPSRTI